MGGGGWGVHCAALSHQCVLSHLHGFEHLVEVKFGHRLTELLLGLDPVEQLSSLHPDGQKKKKTDRRTRTGAIRRFFFINKKITLVFRVNGLILSPVSLKKVLQFKLTTPARCSSSHQSGRNPPS